MSAINRFFRAYSNGSDPMGDFIEHALFKSAKNPSEGVFEIGHYGDNLFELFPSSKKEYPHAETLREDIIRSLSRSFKEGSLHPDIAETVYLSGKKGSARDFAKSFNPGDIVSSAEAYDNPVFFDWFWENVAEPKGLKGIITHDGAVAFDRDNIKRIAQTQDRDWYSGALDNVKSVAPIGVGAGAITAAMLGTPSESHAAMQNMSPSEIEVQNAMALNDYNNRLREQGFTTEEPPLEEPLWSPLDLVTAPVGVAGAGGKALTMALDAPATFALDYGMEKFGDLTNYLDLVAQKTETERQALPMARLGR